MPTINLTNNTDVILTASTSDANASLSRYLKNDLTFKTPPSLASIAEVLVKDQTASAYPVTLSATAEGKFAVEKTTLDVQLGAPASIGLLQGGDESACLAALKLPPDPSSAGLVSFGIGGKLTAGDTATDGDFTFGITPGAAFTLTSLYAARAEDTLLAALKTAIGNLTIPHNLDDLGDLPVGAICKLDANSSLKFSASFTYSFLNDPLATVSLASLPSFNVAATASATIEGSVTHIADHTLAVAKSPDGLIHLSVSLTNTEDLETSLTVSAGAAAKIGTQDALAFLLDKINPSSAAEADAIAAQLADAAQYKSDIKAAIDASLLTALAASLKAALEQSTSQNRMFVYAIDMGALDDASKAAVQSALRGDFTALTATGASLNGVTMLDSALTVTATHTHTMALHFLGIFNAASVDKFVVKSRFDFTADTHEIVLCDESIGTLDDNLTADKLRKLVLKSMTLTLPASANTKDAATPITIAFIDREASAGRGNLRQFANVLRYTGTPNAAAEQALLGKQDHFGTCLLSLALSLDPSQCRKLFSGPDGVYDWRTYTAAFCKAQKMILAGDPDSEERSRLFVADQDDWNDLHEAGAAGNIKQILTSLGMSDTQAQFSVTDVITAVWWSDAMAAYATAMKKGQSLVPEGKEVVKDANLGFNEPWMVLAAWELTGRPAIKAEFVTALPQPAAAAAK